MGAVNLEVDNWFYKVLVFHEYLESLGEFGKHIPNLSNPAPNNQQAQSSSSVSNGSDRPPTDTTPPSVPMSHPPGDIDEMFDSEFVAEAEAQLGEAMKMLSTENPELWQQFESFAKSMGFEESGVKTAPPPTSGAASKGESSVDASGGAVGGGGKGVGGGATPQKDEGAGGKPPQKKGGGAEGGGDTSTLDQKLEDTLKRMHDNAARLGVRVNVYRATLLN